MLHLMLGKLWVDIKENKYIHTIIILIRKCKPKLKYICIIMVFSSCIKLVIKMVSDRGCWQCKLTHTMPKYRYGHLA